MIRGLVSFSEMGKRVNDFVGKLELSQHEELRLRKNGGHSS